MRTEEPFIAQRLKVGALGCIGCTLLYVLRSNLSVAIIAMIDEKAILEDKHENSTDDLCYDIMSYNRTEGHGYKGEFVWSESVQGIILGSYYYGYMCTQILGGQADKFGAKWIVALGVFGPAVCNAFIPVLAEQHYGYVIAMRILIGALHGVVYSSLFSMFAKWFPQSEKIYAISGTTLFGNIGGIITMPLAGYLIESPFLNGWPFVFYLSSLIHVVWLIFWCYFVSSSPEEDKNISERELKYILSNNPNSKANKKMSIPWRAIFTSKTVWASAMVKTTGNFGYYLLCTKMPQYLDSVFGMSIQKNSWFNSLMYAVLCVSLLSGGPLSSWVRNKGWISQTRNRKNFQSIAMFGCALCLLLVPIVGCDSEAVIALLLVSMLVYGLITGGEFGVIVEYAPDFSGTVFGVANTLASTTGFLGPMIVGLLLDHANDTGIRNQWNIIWYLSAAIYIFGGLFYELFGTAEPQVWGVVSVDESNREVQRDKKISIVSEHYKV